MSRDPDIWRELQQREDGFIPAVKRRWIFTGQVLGVTCRFPVELLERIGENRFTCRAVAAMNSPYTPDYVHRHQLEEV